MYFIKNAAKNLNKRKGNTVIVGLIVALLSFVACLSLSLLNTTEVMEKNALSEFAITAKIIKDDVTFSDSFLALDEIKIFAESRYISEARINVQIELSSFTERIVGYNSLESMREFEDEKDVFAGQLIDFSSDSLDCIIPSSLAQKNNYLVGDKLIEKEVGTIEGDFPIEIIGIYNEENPFGKSKVIMGISAIERLLNLLGEDNQAVFNSTEAIFVIDEIENLNKFKNFVAEYNKNYSAIFTNIVKFNDFFMPLRNTANFAFISLVLVLFIGASILIVFNIFTIHERKYEVGVLSAIGMPKIKIILQFVTEIFITTLIAAMIGMALACIAAVPITKSLLETQISINVNHELSDKISPKTSFEKVDYYGEGISSLINPQAKFINRIQAVIEFPILFKVMLIGVLLSILSSFASIIFITRFKPLQILNNRV